MQTWLFILSITSILLMPALPSFATVINVPLDQPSIQAAINASTDGDEVKVSPGTYFENVNFKGKLIKITSASGPKSTTIDGGRLGAVVTFSSGETLQAVLSGFTITDGRAANDFPDGGGVSIYGASPTIQGNIIVGNSADNGGGGVSASFSSALITHNQIENNAQTPGTGGVGGGGIEIGGSGGVQVIGNIISGNTFGFGGGGGGISLFSAGHPFLANNLIADNSSQGGQGGGIEIANDSDAFIVQNVFIDNSAGQGGGVYVLVPSGSHGPILVSNTFSNNVATDGSAVFASGFDDQTALINNLLIAPAGGDAVFCDSTYDQTPPLFSNNDAFSAGGIGFEGACASALGVSGNISADPLFVDAPGNVLSLSQGSPAIDAGSNSAPNLPAQDFAGHNRIVDGNGDGVATIDMGAFEFQG